MAKQKNADAAAAKARKQKIILAAGGLLLVAMAAIQGPKMMQQRGNGAPAPVVEASGSTSRTSASAVAPSAAAPATAPVAVGKTGAVVAGVALPDGRVVVKATKGQLTAFTLFEENDPFVQEVDEEGSGAPGTPTGASGASSAPAATGGSGGPAADKGSTAPSGSSESQKPAAAPIAYATIDLDAKPQQVTVKDSFPEASPLFVLKALKKGQAKIAVAGGAFDGGGTLTLRLGKKVTVVNTATGVRYVLKLVYTGTQPEVIEGFTTGADGSSSTTTPAKTTTTSAN